MVASAVSKSKAALHGIRPLNPVHDLYAVAHLLEEAFRADHTFPLADLPFLREVGVFLWTLNYAPMFPETITGFVWVEDGRVVGNVTITQDEARFERYLISNVAVKQAYQRQGIARQLTLAALDDLRIRGAKTALLNVRPTNPGALELYRDLGFKEIEMRGEWSSPLSPLPPSPSPVAQFSIRIGGRGLGVGVEVRPLRSSDTSAASDLIRAATPAHVQPYRTRRNDFALACDDRIVEAVSDFFIGQVTHRWALEQDSKLAALTLVRAQRITSPHRIAIKVHPDFRGRVENDLVAYALRDLMQFPSREIRAAATSTQPELIAALEQQGFRFWNGLTLMAREV